MAEYRKPLRKVTELTQHIAHCMPDENMYLVGPPDGEVCELLDIGHMLPDGSYARAGRFQVTVEFFPYDKAGELTYRPAAVVGCECVSCGTARKYADA